jgi:Uri superfamily endonuclease
VNGGRTPGGTYVVFLELRQPETIQVAGRCWRLAPGVFAYAGSARGALFPRVLRHLKSRKNIRWHLDHLTSRASVTVPLVLCTSRPDWTECRLVHEIAELHPSARAVAGFGSSDCRSGCPGHLLRLGESLPDQLVHELMGNM